MISKLKKYGDYKFFIATILLFSISLIFLLFIYLNWNKQIESDGYEIEINLPIINWGTYESLSKKQ